MTISGIKAGVVAGIGVIAIAVAGCGGTNVDHPAAASSTKPTPTKRGNPASINNPNSRHVDSMSGVVPKNADVAALSAAPLFTGADATQCDTPDTSVDGSVSNLVWAEYFCTKAMSPQEVQWQCTSGGGGGSGPDTPAKTLSHHPLTKRYVHMRWQAGRVCPGHGTHVDTGYYDATVKKTKAGWIVTEVKTLSGPSRGALL